MPGSRSNQSDRSRETSLPKRGCGSGDDAFVLCWDAVSLVSLLAPSQEVTSFL
jgi:hypothetical protein